MRRSERISLRRGNRRQPARLLALTSLGLVMAALFASAATSQGAGVYTAAVDTTTATAGQSTVFTFTITNDSTSTAPLGSVNITPPSGWTSIQAGNDAVASGGKSWNTVVQGGIVKLRAVTDPDRLVPTEQVSIAVTATFCSAAAPNWSTDANEAIVTDFTGGDFAISGSEPPLQVNPGSAASLTLAAATTFPTAGDSDNLTITAKDGCGNTATSYAGTKDLTFGGASPAPDGTDPTVTSNNGTAEDFGQNTNIDFTAGVSTVSGSNNGVMKLYDAAPASITVTDGTISNGSGLPVTVAPAALDHFTWTDEPEPGATYTAGIVFDDTFQVTAYDQWDNVKTNYTPPVNPFSGLGPSPNGDTPNYGFTWANGVATSTTVTDYLAETTKLKVTDTLPSIFAESVAFTVAPGPLDSFKLSDSINPNDPIDTQTAGNPFAVYATAFDEFGNVKTDYPGEGDTQVFSGLAESPDPSSTDPLYGEITWGSGTGQGTATITAFAAGSSLTITDTASEKTGTSTFTVLPGPLYLFRWTDEPEPGATYTAGIVFDDTFQVTAYDQWDNVKTNYTPPVNPFSGLGPSPNGDTPNYGFTWANGVATSTTVTDYLAETTKLKVTDTPSIFAESVQFTVDPAEAVAPTFTPEPRLSQDAPGKIGGAPPSPAAFPKVTVEDEFGNPRTGDTVNMTVEDSPDPGGSTSFTPGSTTEVISDDGVAMFDNLQIANSGLDYTIRATIDKFPLADVSTPSAAFNVANEVVSCAGTGTCKAEGIVPNNTTVTTTVVAGVNPNLLGLTVAQSVTVPTNVCGVTGPTPFGLGSGFQIDLDIGGGQPSKQVVARIHKDVVKLKPQPNGAASFNVCLGTINVNTGFPGDGLCATPANSSFPKKGGGCAVPSVPDSGRYWGLLPDVPKGVKSCTSPNLKFPAVLSKTKTGAGDVILTFCIPWPYDEKGGFG